ncbi:hypothetical protein LCGC14_0762000 [marine sediment metagenome]|uniref:Uncharacterized protein n=1 Tax=marine sediment metagenome TaxID=412755 RepID=A0A0F9Q4Y5_9ZZZZ|nr:hypothetical protein [bacterium]
MKKSNRSILIFNMILLLSYSIASISADYVLKEMQTTTIEEDIQSSGFIEISYGVNISGTEDGIFSLCRDNLYFYNATNNGSIYRVNLNSLPFTPILVRGNLGNVYDIDAAYEISGDLIYLATAEYNNAIMELNTNTLVYKKIVSSTWIPRELSVEYWNNLGFERIDLTWRTASNVFYWNSLDNIIENIGPDFFGVIDVQYSEKFVLYYNSTEIRLYDRLLDSIELYIYDTGITSAFLDTSRDYIIYAQDDDYDYDADGKIVQYDYANTLVDYIYLNLDYPVDVWCTANYIYWVERGYWSGSSMIYRYSYYYNSPDTHYYSKVSKIGINQWIDRMEFQNMQYLDDKLGVYWVDYYGLFVINGADRIPPEKIEWMSGGVNETVYTVNDWSVSWWNSEDLNGIEDYELLVSKTDNFSNYDTYWVSESEGFIYTSLEFSDMEYGDYYYKIRARDTIGTDSSEESNIGEWSDTFHISYPTPESDGISTIAGYPLLFISVISLVTMLFISKKRFK